MASSAQATDFSCFSKYYTSNKTTISLNGQAYADGEIKKFVMISKDNGINFSLPSIKADADYHGRTYADFNRYYVGENPAGLGFQGLTVLFPKNVASLNGKFQAYVSDANADMSGSNGYYAVLCIAK